MNNQEARRNEWYYFLPFYYLAILIVLSIFGVKVSEAGWGNTAIIALLTYLLVVWKKNLSKWLMLLFFVVGVNIIAYVVVLFVRPNTISRETDHPESLVDGHLLAKCGGCGSEDSSELAIVRDKNNNRGYLCSSCKQEYAQLLEQGSIRRFWMCGACGFRILAGTKIDAEVDPNSRCPNCGADVNASLVNLADDEPIKSGIIGEPLE